jgi:hypothetical protein
MMNSVRRPTPSSQAPRLLRLNVSARQRRLQASLHVFSSPRLLNLKPVTVAERPRETISCTLLLLVLPLVFHRLIFDVLGPLHLLLPALLSHL